MRSVGAAVTCVPVALDGDDWETAIFFDVGGPESKSDRRALRTARSPLPIGLETDLIEHGAAAVVILRLEVFTSADSPLAGEILLTPGGNATHFDSLKLLTTQRRLVWFFGDADSRIVHSQQHALDDAQRSGFDELLRDAVHHDALVRLTGRYDDRAALGELASHYELRRRVPA